MRLKACGWGNYRIARKLGCSHHTVRHYVAARQDLIAEKGITVSLRTLQRAVQPYQQALKAEALASFVAFKAAALVGAIPSLPILCARRRWLAGRTTCSRP